MKIIINLSKKEYDRIQRFKWEGKCMPDDVYYETHCGIPIPDNATNGDVLKALFPVIDRNYNVKYKMGQIKFTEEWWNMPYEGSDVE